MKNMKKKLMTMAAAVTASAMVFGTGITANAMGEQSQYGKEVPSGVTPGGVFVYGCYYNISDICPVYTTDFPVEYLLAIDAAGITNEMSDYEKCVRINDYLCRTVEYSLDNGECNDGDLGLATLRSGKGFCHCYADAFQTMTSMLGIASYMYGSSELEHEWNAVDIDGVRYFVDVTWNDNDVVPNAYLMSTELWANHTADDLTFSEPSPGWEVRQAENEYRKQLVAAYEKASNELYINAMLTNEDLNVTAEKVKQLRETMLPDPRWTLIYG